MIGATPNKAVRDAVARRLGLHFPEERWRDVAKAFDATAREAGIPSLDFAAAFAGDRLERGHVEALAGRLTIGETYFCRAPEANAILREHILPDLLRRRAATRCLRIWSAGCCTGEEPYTIAMMLREMVPDISEWNLSILATDLNPGFLRNAREGVYGAWSFRAMPPETQRRHFSATPDGRFAIDPAIRSMVTFAPLNLCEQAYPANTQAMDLILCRNVLMYFEAGQARRVASRLHVALTDDGWLTVSPCEVSPALFGDFSPVAFPGAVLYRKRAEETRAAAPVRSIVPSVVPWRAPVLRAAQRVPASAQAIAPADDNAVAFEWQALALANEGRLEDALELCTRRCGERKLDVAAHYLRALVAMELGDMGIAEASLRHCAYLAPDEPMVSHAAGNLARANGRLAEAREHYKHAMELLSGRPSDAPVALSEGMAVARLMAHLRGLVDMEGWHGEAA